MSVRTYCHRVWLVAIGLAIYDLLLIPSGIFAKEGRDYQALGVIVAIFFGFLMIPQMLYLEYTRMLRPFGGFRLDKWPDKIPLPPPSHVFRVVFTIICAFAIAPGAFGLIVYILGGPVAIAYTLAAIPFLNLIYVRWRSHTRWEKLFLQ